MPTLGPLSPATMTNDTAFGTTAWSNPGNVASNNGQLATATLVGSDTNYLKVVGFSFSGLSDVAIVTSITVRVRKRSTSAISCEDVRVRLVKADVVQTADLSETGATWANTNVTTLYTFTGANLVGWTGADVKAATFGAVFAATGSGDTANVDSIQIALDYTEPSAGSSGSARANRLLTPRAA